MDWHRVHRQILLTFLNRNCRPLTLLSAAEVPYLAPAARQVMWVAGGDRMPCLTAFGA